MRNIITAFTCIILLARVSAQTDTTRRPVYRVKPKLELPLAAAGVAVSSFGFRQLEKVSTMTTADVLKLDPLTINSFDRPIAYLDPAGFDNAEMHSDAFLNLTLFAPLLLGLDKEIRKDWVDILSLYLASHAADNAVYFAAGFSVRRPRPLTYNPYVPLGDKTGGGKSSSFFSGHTSFSSTATFFMAKVYTDYHHIRGWKRLLIYSAAAVPPALVGYYRMRAGKHFKSDVMLGFLVGASSGILVPELHRNKQKKNSLSFSPYYSEGSSGLTMTVKL